MLATSGLADVLFRELCYSLKNMVNEGFASLARTLIL